MNDPHEHMDLCACYEPAFEPPAALLKEWRDGPKQTPENSSYFAVDIDGTEYFYCCDSCIKVSEHFTPDGKPANKLLEDVIQYAARNKSDS